MAKTYIFLPVHNRFAVTRRFVESLVRQQYGNFHLVLIDDGSTDGTEEMVRSYVDNLTVIRGKGDWWWGGSLHQGYLWLEKQPLAEDDIVLIMNDDTQFEQDYLAIAVDILRNNPRSLLVSRCYDRLTKALVDTGTYQMDFARFKFRMMDENGEVNCTSTRGLFLRASDMLSLGGFYPKLLPHYLSDIEYTCRACNKGMKLITDSRLALFLDEETTGYHGHEYEAASTSILVKRFFSRKSSSNPVYWTVFVLLACPWRSKMKNILLMWAFSLYYLLKQILSPRGEAGQGKKGA
jgi:GT2 family glycosyltransferase